MDFCLFVNSRSSRGSWEQDVLLESHAVQPCAAITGIPERNSSTNVWDVCKSINKLGFFTITF